MENKIVIDINNYNKDVIYICREIKKITMSEFISFLNLLDMDDKSFVSIEIYFNNKVLYLRS